jgi:homoserine kinase
MQFCLVLQMSCDRAVVRSPASIANFGPGFDSFGLCLKSPADQITIRREKSGRVSVKAVGKYKVPTDPDSNTSSYAAMRLAELCGCSGTGFSMTVKKGMKPGSGIGSSAASSVGGAVAMAALLGVKRKELMLEAAAMGEELVTGSRHFDNVAAALHGGFTCVSDLKTRSIVQIRPPVFQVIVVIPEISIETRKAREILPGSVSMSDAVCNVSWATGMVHAMMRRDVRAIGRYLDDKLALPYRKKLIPGYEEVRERALAVGAYGVSIGGSGPAVFAIARGNAVKIKSAMVSAFREASHLRSESFITVPGTGAVVESAR